MLDEIEKGYDEVPYQGQSFVESHPTHLATMGTLFGMNPAPVENCRVLELGCAEGFNLIPVAANLPGSKFIGLDLSSRQIQTGREIINQIGLTNIELHQKDILAVDETLGQFDYIIAHGVYSWVPEIVRQKIFEICNQLLKPTGIVYISYSVYPAGHVRSMVREMMLYHIRNESDSQKRIGKARELFDFLLDAVPSENNAYGANLRWEAKHIHNVTDHHIRHDGLAEVNHPVYFNEFMQKAQSHSLQFLGEAEFFMMQLCGFDEETQNRILAYSSNLIEREQYIDFVRNRSFRASLLCRDNIELNHEVSATQLPMFHVLAPLKSTLPGSDVHTDAEEVFKHPQGAEISSKRPFTKMAFRILADRCPANISFNDLIAQTKTQLSESFPDRLQSFGTPDDIHTLAHALMESYKRNLVYFSIRPTSYVTQPGICPQANPIARIQAMAGNMVTNQRHEMISIDPLKQVLLKDLDGSHTCDQLLDMLVDLAVQGEISVDEKGQKVADPARIRAILAEQLNLKLHELAKQALLVA